ncbi:MAG: RNA polymerase sigma-54 factor, partial [Alphaproteobacteria bacterium]|nr:RNA polymerase sigma-54 factor [Alphaproteobacteria bacterium]
MAIGPRLEQRQGQSLVMTPQLQQAIKLLQMSNIEVQEFVEAELERNPLLERDDRGNLAERPAPVADAQPADMVGELASGRAIAEEPRPAAETPAEERPVAQGASDSGWASLRPSGGAALDGEDLEFGANLSRP